jgi:mannose-6-phosphate isomerase
LGKPIGDETCAESWEIVDHHDDQSIVAAGPLKGTTLGTLVRERGAELLGRHAAAGGQFPLLMKFLDAQQNLSLQVHPDDRQAAVLDPPATGKTEAWVILDAEPGSLIYAGLKRGIDREAFRRELLRGTAELCLHRFEPRVGDCVFLPAGTIHALGAGLMVAEVQQPSDVTYRLFDWNRVDSEGRPRTLHIEAGLKCLDESRVEIGPQTPQPTALDHVTRLVACDKFVLDRWRFSATEAIGGDDRFHLVVVLDGEIQCRASEQTVNAVRGQTVLLPSSLGSVLLETRENTELLDIYLP